MTEAGMLAIVSPERFVVLIKVTYCSGYFEAATSALLLYHSIIDHTSIVPTSARQESESFPTVGSTGSSN